MNAYQITEVDRDAIPEAMLDIAKVHMRVDFADDDEYIKLCLTRAVDMFERYTGWRVFETEFSWSPVVASVARNAYQTPLQPISEFAVMDGSTDVSAEYRLLSASEVEPVYLVRADGTPFASNAAVSMVAGYAADKLPPAVTDAVLMLAASAYEYRESIAVSSLDTIPDWANELLTATWIPRC